MSLDSPVTEGGPSVPDYSALRGELDAAQKSREELMKWKGVAVTGIGAAALGFSGSSPQGAPLALLVLPFACAYVDLLCRNLSLRSKRVTRFLSEEPDDERDPVVRFEKTYKAGEARYALESIALVGSSVLVSVAVVPIGLAASALTLTNPRAVPFIGAGLVGLLLAGIVEHQYRKRRAELRRPASAMSRSA
jgi:hypothetical protein